MALAEARIAEALIAKAKVAPADLPAGMAATDGDFAAHDGVAMLDFDKRANGILIGTRLFDLQFKPMPGIGAGVAP